MTPFNKEPTPDKSQLTDEPSKVASGGFLPYKSFELSQENLNKGVANVLPFASLVTISPLLTVTVL